MGDQTIVSKEPHADWLDVRKRKLYWLFDQQQALFLAAVETSNIQQQPLRRLQRGLDGDKELHRIPAVDEAVVV